MISEAFFYKEKKERFFIKQESNEESDKEYQVVLGVNIFVFWKERIK